MSYERFDEADVLPDRAIFPYNGSLDIHDFLRHHESPLRELSIEGRLLGSVIKQACSSFEIRPEWILVRLQAEQGLIGWYKGHIGAPTQEKLDWALGVGKLDGGKTLEQFRGLKQQIYGAAQATRRIIRKVTPLVGKPYTLDAAQQPERKTLVCANVATLAVYEYTPHVESAMITQSLFRQYFPDLFA